MSVTSLSRRGPALDRRDLVGLSLIAAAVLWTFAAATSGGDPWPTAGMFVLAAAAYALGILAPLAVAALVVALGVVLGLLLVAGVLSGAADAAPFGYVNARSAFYVEAAAATVMIALLGRGRAWSIAWGGVGAILALVPLLSSSEAASFVVVLLLLPAAAVALEGRRLALAVGLSAVLLVGTLGSTVFVAAAPGGSDVARLVGDVVGERRVVLWRDALEILAQDPLTGSGPGRFAVESPTARSDRDARWAHHGFLQQGAETGVVGLALLVLVFVWGFWRLASVPPSGRAVMGAFVLGAVGILACSDYVFHFPLVTGVAAALVGAAVGTSGLAAEGPALSHRASPRRAMTSVEGLV
jgi:O-antigen ligase